MIVCLSVCLECASCAKYPFFEPSAVAQTHSRPEDGSLLSSSKKTFHYSSTTRIQRLEVCIVVITLLRGGGRRHIWLVAFLESTRHVEYFERHHFNFGAKDGRKVNSFLSVHLRVKGNEWKWQTIKTCFINLLLVMMLKNMSLTWTVRAWDCITTVVSQLLPIFWECAHDSVCLHWNNLFERNGFKWGWQLPKGSQTWQVDWTFCFFFSISCIFIQMKKYH